MVEEAGPQLPRGEIMKTLEDKYEIVFYPRRDLCVPKIPRARLQDIFGEKADKVEFLIGVLTEFVEKDQAFADQFGTEHLERRKWEAEMAKTLGPHFQEMCERNQFGLNHLMNIMSVIYQLPGLAGQSQLKNKEEASTTLREAYNDLYVKLRGFHPETDEKVGKAYGEIESPDEKIKIVHFFEEKALEVMQLFAQTEE